MMQFVVQFSKHWNAFTDRH